MLFDKFFILKPRVVLAEVGCGNRHPIGVNHLEALDDKAAECDAFLSTLEPSAWRMADKVQRVQNQFDCAGEAAWDLYGQTVIEVRTRALPVTEGHYRLHER